MAYRVYETIERYKKKKKKHYWNTTNVARTDFDPVPSVKWVTKSESIAKYTAVMPVIKNPNSRVQPERNYRLYFCNFRDKSEYE